jgi:hypothetical protein
MGLYSSIQTFKGKIILSWNKNPNINGLFEKVWRQIYSLGPWVADSWVEHPRGNFCLEAFHINEAVLRALRDEIEDGFFELYVCTGCFWGSPHREEEMKFVKEDLPMLEELVKTKRIYYISDW